MVMLQINILRISIGEREILDGLSLTVKAANKARTA